MATKKKTKTKKSVVGKKKKTVKKPAKKTARKTVKKAARKTAPPKKVSAKPKSSEPILKKKSPALAVLLVEDVDEMREMLGTLIESIEGVVCRSVSNTFEARVELNRRRPDVVLLDEVLPGESSLDLLSEIQALGVRVILMTGMETRTHELPPGVQERLVKPSWKSLDEAKDRFAEAILLKHQG